MADDLKKLSPDEFMTLTCTEFSAVLASKEPAPGGGGGSAYVGALGAALGTMVGNLTLGKAKYADVQEEIEALMARAEALRKRLHELVAEDAHLFAPLARAYGLPSDTPAQKKCKEETLELALLAASDVPLAIMRACAEVILLCQSFAAKGSRLAVSDAAAGAVFAKAGLVGASLNVYINTKLMKDPDAVARLNAESDELIEKYGTLADEVLAAVMGELRGA